MKNMFTAFLCLFASGVITAQHIPDANLAAAIRWSCASCIDSLEIGCEVLQTKNLNMDISTLPSGIYFAHIQIQSDKVVKKIVKL